jgi:hypothetical protein
VVGGFMQPNVSGAGGMQITLASNSAGGGETLIANSTTKLGGVSNCIWWWRKSKTTGVLVVQRHFTLNYRIFFNHQIASQYQERALVRLRWNEEDG